MLSVLPLVRAEMESRVEHVLGICIYTVVLVAFLALEQHKLDFEATNGQPVSEFR